MPDEEQGFTVNDRRFFNQDGRQKAEEEANASAPPREAGEQAPADQGQTAGKGEEKEELDGSEYRNLPPADFGTFIISLAHAVMFHMGQGRDSAVTRKDMAMARHTIDTIAMLKSKTSGNLELEEQSLIDGILAELRMQYVQTCKKQ
jgi:hypothetical protein